MLCTHHLNETRWDESLDVCGEQIPYVVTADAGAQFWQLYNEARDIYTACDEMAWRASGSFPFATTARRHGRNARRSTRREASARGRHIVGGICSTVGHSGFAQGGGYGFYTRWVGSAAGNVVQAEVRRALAASRRNDGARRGRSRWRRNDSKRIARRSRAIRSSRWRHNDSKKDRATLSRGAPRSCSPTARVCSRRRATSTRTCCARSAAAAAARSASRPRSATARSRSQTTTARSRSRPTRRRRRSPTARPCGHPVGAFGSYSSLLRGDILISR